MPLHPGRLFAFSVLIAGLGLCVAPARAADMDDYGYGWEQRGPDYGHWRHGEWNRGGWDDGAVRGAAAQPGYGGCYVVERPLRDGWGNIVDYRSVEVCE